MPHEASALDRRRLARGHRAHPRPRELASRRSPAGRSRRSRRCAGAPCVNLFYEASTRTQSSFDLAAKRLSADVVTSRPTGSSRGEGRVAEGHGADALRLQPGGDRHPLAARRRRRPRRPLDPGRGRQRRRRQARAPDAGAARRLHAAPPHRRARRREASGSSATSCTRASRARTSSPSAHGRRGDRRRAADADPARDRGARLRRRATRSTGSATPTSSTPCACSTSA